MRAKVVSRFALGLAMIFQSVVSPDERQHREWIEACKGGPAPYSNFDVAAYLTEIILLGCVALRTGKKLQWDGPGMEGNQCSRRGSVRETRVSPILMAYPEA